MTPQRHFSLETRFGLSYGDVLDLIDAYKDDQEKKEVTPNDERRTAKYS